MKLTRHNGRSGKHGTYNPRHNDRRFDVENSEHIDAERARQNVYWDCYRGFTTHEFRENPEQPDFSFEEIERMYYYEHYGGYVEAQNARNEKTRHTERNRTVEDLLKNNKTCPEESIYQIGTMGESVSPDTLFSIVNEFYQEFERRFGSHIHILDWALHLDEGTPHIHERHVFAYTYVFEDNFPLVGDYDFNDVVLDVSINYDRGRDNKITATHIDVTLVAAGATKTIGAGLRLVNVDGAAVANVSYEGDVNRFQNTLSGSMLDNISFEDGMVIPLFGNVHDVFGVAPGTMVNTGIATAPTYTYKIKIEQSNAYQHESPVISKNNLDFFIAYKFRSMQQRMEVHLYEFWGYGATKGGTVQKENLDLAGNNTWAICVPNFRYPRESINISTLKGDDCAYPLFLKWAQNRTPENEDWHLHPNENNVYR